MLSRNRMMIGAIALISALFMLNVFAFAEPVAKASPGAAANQGTTETATNVTAKPADESPPPDARALTPDEVTTYQSQSDSTTQSPQVQQMNVGMTVDGTLVLSILVALVIFAVLIAVL